MPIRAPKSLFGHTLGAGGALAGVVCAMTLDTGQIHPTVNYDDPDPDCALPGISPQAQERPVTVALLNAFGFGSNNTAVGFTKFFRATGTTPPATNITTVVRAAPP